jgi:hypothetical protein
MPDLILNNPKYALFTKAWKKLPIGMSRMLGPWLAKGLA